MLSQMGSFPSFLRLSSTSYYEYTSYVCALYMYICIKYIHSSHLPMCLSTDMSISINLALKIILQLTYGSAQVFLRGNDCNSFWQILKDSLFRFLT